LQPPGLTVISKSLIKLFMPKTSLLKPLLCCLALCFSLQAKLQIITTIAGNGTQGYAGDNGLALNAELYPWHVSCDSHDNIFISESHTQVIRKVNASTGIITTVAGNGTAGFSGDNGPATDAQLNGPANVAIDSFGNTYIADAENQRIRKVDGITGIITTIAGTGEKKDAGDGGLAINASFNTPVGVAIDKSNSNLYVVDLNGCTIRKINLSTSIITTIAGKNSNPGYNGDEILATNSLLNYPYGIALDSTNNIYISDYNNARIRKIDATDGIIHTIAGNGIFGYTGDSGLASNAEIGYVWGVAVDKKNNLYIGDWGWNIVRKVSLTDSIITTISGTGAYGNYTGDGVLATKAILGQPWGIATDSKSNVYTVEPDFYRVRKITVDSSALNEEFGYAFYDLNSNDIKDSSEPLFSTGKIIIKGKTDSTITLISGGNFRIGVDTGNYTSSFVPFKNYYTAVPQSHSSYFSGYNNIDTVHFALQPLAGKTDIDISMYALMPPVPGFGSTYMIRYHNAGTDTISNGDIQLVKDSKFNFVSSSPNYTSINGDTIHWNYSNLKPLDTASIVIKLVLPSGVSIGDTVHSIATINPVTGDLFPADDTASVVQKVVGSYDPNNKSESHAGSVSTSEVKNGDYLTYTIRFQNTGTYAAFNIVVRDTLSDKLDWNSFEMVGASHNYQLSITGGNKCTWYFNGIGLPDSNSNEPASHGYIVYRVKLKKTLAAGNVINNTAGIYFDYNAPVQTNTEKTVVQNLVLPLQLLSFTAQRNNETNLLKWSTADEINTDHFEIQRSSNGKDFSAIGYIQSLNNGKITNNYQYTDNSPLKGVNFYRLKMVDKDGKYTYSLVRSINNASSFDVTVYPNPVKNNLVLDFISEKNLDMQLQIINAEGKILLYRKIEVVEGESKQTINASALSAGNYFIKLISSEGETALRFIKQ
jgi:uncharacterized repeat protein (TIGR01451 family)